MELLGWEDWRFQVIALVPICKTWGVYIYIYSILYRYVYKSYCYFMGFMCIYIYAYIFINVHPKGPKAIASFMAVHTLIKLNKSYVLRIFKFRYAHCFCSGGWRRPTRNFHSQTDWEDTALHPLVP